MIGVTGSGKTGLMQLLTGTTEASSGDILMNNLSLARNPREFLANLGYCPETLGLPDHLTGREVSIISQVH